MKGHLLVIAAVVVAGTAAPAAAGQSSSPLVRADLSGTIGWFSANRSLAISTDDWAHRSFYGGVEAGWYWTDHLKTEVDFGAHTTGTARRGRTVIVDGLFSYESSELSFRERKVTLVGQYQFGRNAWFHPHAGAGVDLSWESSAEQISPLYSYGDPSHGPALLRDARTESRRGFVVRPCAEIGFKAYITPRAFFRADLRLRTGKRIDEALARFGFGADF